MWDYSPQCNNRKGMREKYCVPCFSPECFWIKVKQSMVRHKYENFLGWHSSRSSRHTWHSRSSLIGLTTSSLQSDNILIGWIHHSKTDPAVKPGQCGNQFEKLEECDGLSNQQKDKSPQPEAYCNQQTKRWASDFFHKNKMFCCPCVVKHKN